MRWVPWALAAAALIYCLWWAWRLLGRAGRQAAAKMEARKAIALREVAWRNQAGASPDSPIELESASVVEPRAESSHCPVCDHPMRVAQHMAETRAGKRLRVVSLRCDLCGDERELFFRLREK